MSRRRGRVPMAALLMCQCRAYGSDWVSLDAQSLCCICPANEICSVIAVVQLHGVSDRYE